jgi:hypothetical protein
MITANRRARATIAFFIPRDPALHLFGLDTPRMPFICLFHIDLSQIYQAGRNSIDIDEGLQDGFDASCVHQNFQGVEFSLI